MTCHIVIPARFQSGRLKNKLVLDLGGKPVLQHTYEKAVAANVGQVIIATDDERIQVLAQGFGADVLMTASTHQSGTERLAEVIKKRNIPDDDIVINVQGDGPFIAPQLIQKLAQSLEEDQTVNIATLATPIKDSAEIFNIHSVKVLINAKGHATYFSRAPLPYFRDGFAHEPKLIPENYDYYWHIGLYAYRAHFVERYVSWPISPWEKIESLEQLRVLWHGEPIRVDVVEENIGIDINTEHDLLKARSLF